MANKNQMIYGIFDDADRILDAAYKFKDLGVKIQDCYTPHPVHNLDRAMGIKRTRLTVAAFMCGGLGTLTAIILQIFMNVNDWPMIIGGKPNDGFYPNMIPVMFELTILFTAFGMGILFFYRTKMVHGANEQIIDLRQTDDLYIMAIEVEGKNFNKDLVNKTLVEHGAIEIREQEANNEK